MVPCDRNVIDCKAWPKPTLTFQVGFFEFVFGVLLIQSLVVSIEEFGIGMRIFPDDFCNTSLTFPLLVQLSTWYWTWFNLVFLARCTQLNHLEYTALFTKHLVYTDIKEDMLWKRYIYIYMCFTSRYCQHILHKKWFKKKKTIATGLFICFNN